MGIVLLVIAVIYIAVMLIVKDGNWSCLTGIVGGILGLLAMFGLVSLFSGCS